jgi:hypothetical protein
MALSTALRAVTASRKLGLAVLTVASPTARFSATTVPPAAPGRQDEIFRGHAGLTGLLP